MKIQTKLIRGCQQYSNNTLGLEESTFDACLNKALETIHPSNLIDVKYNALPHPKLKGEVLFTALIIYKT